MFERNKHETLQTANLPEAKKGQEKIKTWRDRLRLMAAHTAITVTALLGVYSADSFHGEQIEAAAEVDISFFAEPLDPANSDSALVLFNGFNKEDSLDIGAAFGPIAQQLVDGEVWLANYGKAALSPEAMSDKIIAMAKERGINKISIVGYSAGGGIGVETLEFIVDDSNLRIPMIMAISSPSSIDTLRPYQQQEMANAAFIADIPGASHSTFLRFGGELYFRRDRYDEGSPWQRAEDFFATSFAALEDLNDDELTATALLIDQVISIANANFDERLMHISKSTGPEQKPVVVYLGTAKPGRDYIVDNAAASEEICNAAEGAELECFIYDVPGAVHSLPAKAHDAYVETVAQATPIVQSAIAREAILDALRNYTVTTPIFK